MINFVKYFLISLLLLALTVVVLAGVRGRKFDKPPIELFPDMDRQLKKKAQKPGDFFGDGRVAREPVPGTVPMGYEWPRSGSQEADLAAVAAARVESPYGAFTSGTSYLETGHVGEFFGDGIPLPVTPALIERGRERYNINCAVCHGAEGLGKGTASPYWAGAPIANLHDQRLVEMPDGQIYHTIVHGKGAAPNWTMFPYGDKITIEDRWAIVAYIRTLQAALATQADTLPAGPRALLDQAAANTTSASTQ